MIGYSKGFELWENWQKWRCVELKLILFFSQPSHRRYELIDFLLRWIIFARQLFWRLHRWPDRKICVIIEHCERILRRRKKSVWNNWPKCSKHKSALSLLYDEDESWRELNIYPSTHPDVAVVSNIDKLYFCLSLTRPQLARNASDSARNSI